MFSFPQFFLHLATPLSIPCADNNFYLSLSPCCWWHLVSLINCTWQHIHILSLFHFFISLSWQPGSFFFFFCTYYLNDDLFVTTPLFLRLLKTDTMMTTLKDYRKAWSRRWHALTWLDFAFNSRYISQLSESLSHCDCLLPCIVCLGPGLEWGWAYVIPGHTLRSLTVQLGHNYWGCYVCHQ